MCRVQTQNDRSAGSAAANMLNIYHEKEVMARLTGLEPATSGVTGRHSNQLSYNRSPQPLEPLFRWCEGCVVSGPLSVKREKRLR